ncbi:hypothetical protein ABFP60_17620, partial [Clostridioides difficile]
RGRGLYNYLTGSASWLLLTMVEEVFGIKGDLGDLIIEPKLVNSQISERNTCSITTIFADKNITFEYIGNIIDGKIDKILVDDNPIQFKQEEKSVRVSRGAIIDKIKDGSVISIKYI